ncbi:helix-turn-helix domain-containing protein [Sporosarcina sp. FSL W7-1283]|uniref:helix-turn-helix domain-containing protein n=1 Tax=Sporosarcina sp. FSL W7-1283 TaxID=2921560 RepID=UPI0030FCA4DC
MNIRAIYPVRLREERKKRGWTQKKAAEKIGISRSYFSDIENGRTLPSGEILFNINDEFQIFLIICDADRVRNESGRKVTNTEVKVNG